MYEMQKTKESRFLLILTTVETMFKYCTNKIVFFKDI